MFQTRLHSSRMRAARAWTVSPSMLCAGGSCMVLGGRGVHGPGGVHDPGGGAWSREGGLSRGVCLPAIMILE